MIYVLTYHYALEWEPLDTKCCVERVPMRQDFAGLFWTITAARRAEPSM